MRFITHILDIKNILGMQRNIGEYMTFICAVADPVIYPLSCGHIEIRTTKNGIARTEMYNNLINAAVAIQADANTTITIIGNVSTFIVDGVSYDITSIDVTHAYSLDVLGLAHSNISVLDVSQNSLLRDLSVNQCVYLASLDLTGNAELQNLDCGYCNSLTDLDISGCLELTTLALYDCTQLVTIRTRAIDSNVANEVANIITQNTGLGGTVYLDSADPYYSVIETAAISAGWTVAAL